MGGIYLSVGLAAAARKRRILELIHQGPDRGVVAVTLHAHFGNDRQPIEPSWVYDYGTDPQQIETVVETVDRHIVDASSGNDQRYQSATVEVIDRPCGKSPHVTRA
jgi:hypothetical protein